MNMPIEFFLQFLLVTIRDGDIRDKIVLINVQIPVLMVIEWKFYQLEDFLVD